MSLAISSSGFAGKPSPQSSPASQAAGKPAGKSPLSAEDQANIDKLKKIDRQVRLHEQAHLAAAAGIAVSGANYTLQRGADGISYAVGGDVRIDTSPGRTPEETLRKAAQIRAAALAPAQPSAQDRNVASQASSMALDAQSEISQAHTKHPAAADDKMTSGAIAAYRAQQSAGNTRPETESGISVYA